MRPSRPNQLLSQTMFQTSLGPDFGRQALTTGRFDSPTTEQTATNFQSMLDSEDLFNQGIDIFHIASLEFEDDYKASP